MRVPRAAPAGKCLRNSSSRKRRWCFPPRKECRQSYYDKLAANYAAKRERLLKILTASGFTVYKPRGAYYIMTDISRFHFDEAKYPADTRDVSFAKYLVEHIGVACVPGSSFYNDARDGASQVRFTFCKKEATLAAAEARLANLHA